MKRALVTGVSGQDGAYLSKFLLEKGYRVYGTYRRLSTPNFWRLQHLGVFEKINLISCDLIDENSITEALRISRPNEVYNLAAQSFVGASFEQPTGTGMVTGLGVTRVLEAVRQFDTGIRVYQASTSELYGTGGRSKQNEGTPFYPASPYAAAKLYGHHMARIYRDAYGIFACNGILFNHESPLRGLEFVTRKISNGVAKIALGIEKNLSLGNLDAKRDWGYAPEYVRSMWLMLQQKMPDDYVIATGESHSVREFVSEAFNVAGLDWKKHVKVDRKFMRPLEVNLLRGDSRKAGKKLGWKPNVKFRELVRIMVENDMSLWRRWMDGEHFPWDAPSYPSEANILSRNLRV
ncbi:MAG: GDP-mannose 4,6-dehydratase [Candidatus Altiarchaeota archaeon]|nr:GDP-mannose 4,6-dehydratase [Candidatus Altiarchaeota archaeon]